MGLTFNEHPVIYVIILALFAEFSTTALFCFTLAYIADPIDTVTADMQAAYYAACSSLTILHKYLGHGRQYSILPPNRTSYGRRPNGWGSQDPHGDLPDLNLLSGNGLSVDDSPRLKGSIFYWIPVPIHSCCRSCQCMSLLLPAIDVGTSWEYVVEYANTDPFSRTSQLVQEGFAPPAVDILAVHQEGCEEYL